MTGVEILSSETIYNDILPECWMIIGLFGAILFASFTIVSFFNDYSILGCVYLVMAIASIVVFVLGGTESKTDVSHIEYKVTIDDSVSMNKFLDKYEIIGQEGKIYTVKEKSKEN